MSTPRHERLVIIGSGPAALTAAIYAARAELSPLVFEGEPVGIMLPGGQLMITTEVENYPGFRAGIAGPELIAEMQAQADRFGVRRVMEMVTEVDFSKRPFTIKPSYSEAVTADAVIVATGASAKWLGLENEMRLAQSGGGVSACAVCDGAMPIYRNKVLAVVGAGDSACEEATYLSKFASEVVMLVRREEFTASRIMADRVLKNPKIRIEWNTRVADVLGDDFVTGLVLEDTRTGERREMEAGGLFIAIGHKPNTDFLAGQLDLTPHGYIKVQPGRTLTSIEGVFAAGDVADDYYRQAITAAGTGCMAALDAERWLAHHE